MKRTRKFLAILLSICMLSSLCVVGASAAGTVATVGSTTYTSLQAAVDAVYKTGVNTTITLTANASEAVTIPAEGNITLDLNGHTLDNQGISGDTIYNVGTLTIIGAGDSQIVSKVGRMAAIYNAGTLYLNGGKVIGKAETTADTTDDAKYKNSYYTVLNQGTMEIGAASVTTASTYSSCILNGWSDSVDRTGAEVAPTAPYTPPALTIQKGADISGGKYVIKNGESGISTVLVRDGSVKALSGSTAALYNKNTAVVPYTFTDSNGEQHTLDYPTITVNGGAVSGDLKTLKTVSGTGWNPMTNISIQGGTFTNVKADTLMDCGRDGTFFSRTYPALGSTDLTYHVEPIGVTTFWKDGKGLIANSIKKALESATPQTVTDPQGVTHENVRCVQLNCDTAENVIIPTGVTAMLNLNGHNLQNLKSGNRASWDDTLSEDNITVEKGATLFLTNFDRDGKSPDAYVDNDTAGAVVLRNNGTVNVSQNVSLNKQTVSGNVTDPAVVNDGTLNLRNALVFNFVHNESGSTEQYAAPCILNGSTDASAAELNIAFSLVYGGSYTVTNSKAASVNMESGTLAVSERSLGAIENLSVTPDAFTIQGGYVQGKIRTETDKNRLATTVENGYFTEDPGDYALLAALVEQGTWTSGKVSYVYRVTSGGNAIAAVLAEAEVSGSSGNPMENVTASQQGNTILISGKISSADKILNIETIWKDGRNRLDTINLTAPAAEGGSFTGKPDSADLSVASKTAFTLTLGDQDYTVDLSGLTVLPAQVKVADAAPKIAEVQPSNVAETTEAQAVVTAVQNMMQTAETAPVATGLDIAAKDQVAPDGTVTLNNGTAVKTDTAAVTLTRALGKTVEAKDVKIVLQPRLDIQITAAETTTTGKSVTLDIKPVCDVVVTTAATVGDINTTAGATQNAVTVGTKALTVSTPTVVRVTLPGDFISENDTLFVDHDHNGTHEILPVNVATGTATVASFTTSTFSTFKFLVDNRSCTVHFPDGAETTYQLNTATAKLPAGPAKSGYDFTGWKFDGVDGTYTTMTDALLTALNGETVTATAQYTPASTVIAGTPSIASFAINATAGANGAISPSGSTSVVSGKDQTFTITPDKGYAVADVLVDGKSVGAVTTYTFSKVDAAHTIAVTFKAAAWTNPYTDVTASYWAYDAIAWASSNGYMNGASTTSFNPQGSVTRQQLWMVLARLAGAKPATMAEARQWALDNKVSDGSNAAGAVSRQQMVTILCRYAAMKGYKADGSADLTKYPDSGKVSSYASDALAWGIANGVLNGTADGNLNPTGTTNRAQFATLLQRFCTGIVK